MVFGAVWGIVASIYYHQVIGRLVLPYAVPLAVTIFLPGAIGKIFAYNVFGYAWPYVEVAATVISMFAGMVISYLMWLLYKIRNRTL
jgi:hypothetical protein